MSIMLKAEATPGDGLEEVVDEMLAWANRLQVRITVDFNKVPIWVRPGDSPRRVLETYQNLRESLERCK